MNFIRPCPYCRSDAASARLHRDSPTDWQLVTCGSCEGVFLKDPPDYDTLESDFSWDQTFQRERIAREKAAGKTERTLREALISIRRSVNRLRKRDKLRTLAERFFPPGGKILDLGCDTGYNVESLPPSCVPIGIEIAGELARIAEKTFSKRGGYVIHADVLSGLAKLPDASIDGVVAKSYLEHEVRPGEVLAELGRVLKSGAPLIVKVPNFACLNRFARGRRWCGYRFPDHVNYFTPAKLRYVLESAGFSIVRMGFTDALPTSDSMWCVAFAPGEPRSGGTPRIAMD